VNTILIFHKDVHIGPAIEAMIQGIKTENHLPDIEIEVKQDFKFLKPPKTKRPTLIVFDEQILKHTKFPVNLPFINEKSTVILISKSGKVSKKIYQNSSWKFSKVMTSPIERKELSSIIVPLFKIKISQK